MRKKEKTLKLWVTSRCRYQQIPTASPPRRLVYAKKATEAVPAAVCLKYQRKSVVDMESVSRTSVGAKLVFSDLHVARRLVHPTIALSALASQNAVVTAAAVSETNALESRSLM